MIEEDPWERTYLRTSLAYSLCSKRTHTDKSHSSEESQNLTAKIILGDSLLQLSCFMEEKLRPREGKKISQDTQPVSHTMELDARL